MFLSIIIPTYNEIEHISLLIKHLQILTSTDFEIIVSDGGSTDGTQQKVNELNVRLVQSPVKGRSQQLNYAAAKAKGDVLYFLHADSLPPITLLEDIKQALGEGFPIGCYRFKFNSTKKILKLNSYFTRFDRLMCRGGDQSLYITKELFKELNGYNESFKIMEDYDIIIRARKKYSFKIIPKNVIVSARKYDFNSYLKVNIANFIIFMMFFAKADQDRMIRFYRRMLSHNKSELKY